MLANQIVRTRPFHRVFITLFLAATASAAQTPIPATWQTHAEKTGYLETARYPAVVEYCRRLAAASPIVHYTDFGTSGEGRPLPLLVVSANQAFHPTHAHADDHLVVLLLNCIHPGECAGKDACLALARDIAITETARPLAEHVTLLIAPIFSPDGHERFSAYSRINQVGPREMGWRATGTNINLNRDFTKADAVEMQHFLRLWNTWRPDLFFDNHTTDGSDHQYELTYAASMATIIDPQIAAWLDEFLLPPVLENVADDGFNTFWYSFPRDRADLSAGISAAVAYSPRYSTGFGAIHNRPTFLLEAHSLKTYKDRVLSTYSFIHATLTRLNQNPASLRKALRDADERCRHSRGAGPDGKLVLDQRRTNDFETVQYLGIEARRRESKITGKPVLEYTGRPIEVETRLYNGVDVANAIEPPLAYLVPPQWTQLTKRLDWHGVDVRRLTEPAEIPVERFRFEDVEFPKRPYESRFQPRYKTATETRTELFPAGTLVVPMEQVRAKVVAHLLEPQAPDALVAWGLINGIFEQKEYFETYAMEPIARRMLENDPKLREEFEQRLAEDEAFAAQPRARLNFFYKRSPYRDDRLNLYPVARITDEAAFQSLTLDEE